MTTHTLTLSIQCAGVLPADLERDLFLSLPPGSPLRTRFDEMQEEAARLQEEAGRLQSVVDGLLRALEALDDHARFAPEAELSSVLRMTNALSGWGEDDAEAWNDPRARARLVGARLWSELRNGRWEARA